MRTDAYDAPRLRRAGWSLGTVVLAVSGLLLTALYAVATVRAALPEYFPGPGRVSLAFTDILGPDWRRTSVQYVGLVVAAFVLYGVALAAVWRRQRGVHPLALYGFPVLFCLALLWMYPPTAVDLFHYLADARTFWVYGANPLTVPPLANPYPIGISWAEQPSPYGPFWQLLTAGPPLLMRDNYIAGLLLFKALAVVFYLGCIWLVRRIVAEVRPGWETVAVVLFAWNPFIVLRTAGNGHNDLVMMFFALLAFDAARRRDWLIVFPALALSVLVKYVSALLAPPILLYAWFHAGATMRGRAWALTPGVGAALAVTVLSFAPFWAGADTFKTVLNEANGKMITSIPLILEQWLELRMDPDAARAAAQRATRLFFIALYLPLVWQARRDYPRLLSCCANALFLYLIIASAWFRPWYILWPLTLMALLPGTWYTPLLLVTGLFMSFPDLVEQYRDNWDWIAADYWRGLTAAVVVQEALPVLVWLAGLLVFRSWHFDVPRKTRDAGTSRPTSEMNRPPVRDHLPVSPS